MTLGLVLLQPGLDVGLASQSSFAASACSRGGLARLALWVVFGIRAIRRAKDELDLAALTVAYRQGA